MNPPRASGRADPLDRARHPRLAASVGAILVVLFACASSRAGTCKTFFDGEFVPGQWNYVEKEAGSGGTATFWQWCDPSCWERITIDIAVGCSQVAGIYLKATATHDPATQGEIVWIDYSEDARWVQGAGPQGQATGPALRQDGEIYIVPNTLITGLGTTWHPLALSDLRDGDFARIAADGCEPDQFIDWGAHPDFSASGGLIEFGFSRGNSSPSWGNGYRTVAEIDNWNVSLAVSPEVRVEGGPPTTISWGACGPDATYDAVRGDLLTLIETAGDFTAALDALTPSSSACLADDTTATSLPDDHLDPLPGAAWFYLVRCGDGTYDGIDAAQQGGRDAGIGAASGACP